MAAPPTNEPPPVLTPDVFSVSRRFDMATILVAMLGYAILFAGLRLLNEVVEAPPAFIGVVGLFFAVVAIGQAVAIRWNNPRAASVIAGTLFWLVITLIAIAANALGSPIGLAVMLSLCALTLFGPISGYLAGTLVGGVFLVSHYLRETKYFRRRAPAEGEEGDSPWGPAPRPKPSDDDDDWPVMIEAPPPDQE